MALYVDVYEERSCAVHILCEGTACFREHYNDAIATRQCDVGLWGGSHGTPSRPLLAVKDKQD